MLNKALRKKSKGFVGNCYQDRNSFQIMTAHRGGGNTKIMGTFPPIYL